MTDESARLRPPLAPRWHTLLLVSLIVGVAAMGTFVVAASEAPTAPAPTWRGLASLAIVQAGLVVYVARVGRGGWVLAERSAAAGRGPRETAVDVAFAGVTIVAIVGAESLWIRFAGARRAAAAGTLSPHTPAVVTAWIAAAVLVGVAEEIVYRGYLPRHLGALLRSPRAGVVASAVLFGIAHLEQGASFAMRAGVYGLALGAIAQARGRLFPCMVAHVCVDVLAVVGSR